MATTTRTSPISANPKAGHACVRPSPHPAANWLAEAECALRLGRLADAIAALQQAVTAEPSDAPVQHDLGFLCLQAGRPHEAATALEAALTAQPDFTLAALRLGIARQILGQFDAALAAFDRAMAGQPEAAYRAGALLETLGRRADAIAAFRQAAASPTALGKLSAARAAMAQDQDDDAEALLQTLLCNEPGNAAANDLLGLILANRGRFEQARACYERAIAAAPLLAGSYYDLVRCRRILPADGPIYARIERALEIPGLPQESRVKLHLALGKVADDFGDPAAAMRHFDAADTVRRSLAGFDPAQFDARINRSIAQFPQRRSIRQPGYQSPAPIFIFGLPRSGTTLVEQILSCHPDVHPGGELPFWTERASLWQAAPPGDETGFLATAGSDYLGILTRRAPHSRRVTDKMPLNILHAGLIHQALPAAVMIHCRRAPIETALSIHQTYFNPYAAFPTGGAALVAAVRGIERLGAHWRSVLPPDRFIELNYNELIAAPAQVIPRLVAKCGLTWHDACLHPQLNERVIKTPSKWQARQPITCPAAPSWHRFAPWLGALGALISQENG